MDFIYIPGINRNKRFQQCFIDRRESTKDGGFISNINKKKIFGVAMNCNYFLCENKMRGIKIYIRKEG